MTVQKLYRVLPGIVTSRNDGDRHYVDAQALMRLYRVDPAACIIGPERMTDVPGLILLCPDYSGVYALPGSASPKPYEGRHA